jgi:pimeloyl-ACP methyl ester carboxylesterase
MTLFDSPAREAAFFTAYDELLERWCVPVEGLELGSDFGTTHVNVCGPVGAPPVVLLAGHGSTSPVWFAQAARLSRSHRLHAVDLIGDAGRSVQDGTALAKPEDLLSWFGTVLDGLELASASLCGHSYGARLALSYALQTPERVDRLALIDPTSCFTALSTRYVARALPMLLRPTVARYESFLRWETQGVPLESAWVHLSGLAAADYPAKRVVRPKRPSRTALSELKASTLVVVAGRSKAHRPELLATRAQELLSGAAVVRIEEATHHSLPAAHAEELGAALLTHLA